MTNSKKGLNGRWKQFNNSIHGKKGHSGGNRIRRDLEKGEINNIKFQDTESLVEKLYVCSQTLEPDVNVFKEERTFKDLTNMGVIAYLEYKALAEYKKIAGFKGIKGMKPTWNEPRYNLK